MHNSIIHTQKTSKKWAARTGGGVVRELVLPKRKKQNMQQVLHENGSIINGDGKIVFGKRCSVSGNNTKVFGDFCQISGDNVVNSGNYSQISGDHVRNDGTGCVIRGDHIKNYGKRCQLRGDNIKNMGDDCLLSGDNITNYGANCVFAGGRNFTDMSEGRKETPTSMRRVGAIGTSCIDVGVVGSVRGYGNVISGSGGCAVAVCGSGSVSAAASASGDNVDVSSVTAVNGVAIGTNYGKLLNTFGVSKSSAAIPKKTVITNKITRSGVSINVESQGSSVLTISDDDDDDDDDDDGPKIVRFDLDSVLIKGKHLPTMNIGTCKAGTDVTVQGFRIVSLRDISVKTIKEGILISGLTDEEVDLLLSQ